MKKVAALFFIAFIISVPLKATETAVSSMQLPVWATEDDSLTYTLFPQLLPDFSQRLVLEYGAVGIRGYTNFEVLGGTSMFGVTFPYQGNVVNGNPQFAIGYGRSAGPGKMGVVLFLGPNHDSINPVEPEITTVSNRFSNYASYGNVGLLAGISTKIVIPVDLSFSISYPYRTVSEVTGEDSQGHEISYDIERESGLNIGLNARSKLSDFYLDAGISFNYYNKLEDSKRWVPPAYDLQQEAKKDNDDYLINLFLGGVYNWKPVNGVLIKPGLVGVLTLDFYSEEVYSYISHVTRTTVTPVDSWSVGVSFVAYMGGEAKLYKSWKLRGGIAKPVLGVNYKKEVSLNSDEKIVNGETETLVVSSPAVLTLGVSGKIGFVVIDMRLNTNFFLNGPYFLSGTATPLAAQVAFSMVW